MATYNYAIDNTCGVLNFETNQKSLIKVSLDEEAIEDQKPYHQKQKEPRKMRINNYIRKLKTLKNYMPLMDIGAVKLMER